MFQKKITLIRILHKNRLLQFFDIFPSDVLKRGGGGCQNTPLPCYTFANLFSTPTPLMNTLIYILRVISQSNRKTQDTVEMRYSFRP